MGSHIKRNRLGGIRSVNFEFPSLIGDLLLLVAPRDEKTFAKDLARFRCGLNVLFNVDMLLLRPFLSSPVFGFLFAPCTCCRKLARFPSRYGQRKCLQVLMRLLAQIVCAIVMYFAQASEMLIELGEIVDQAFGID